MLNVNVYDVTEQGKAFFNAGNMFSRAKFCTGILKLVSIGTFTEPSETNAGAKLSQVNYTVDYENVAPWANDSELEKLFARRLHKIEKQQRTILILTNEGWKSKIALNQSK
ncbi:Uncharacterised protein [uncultured Avibacterium sp.]|uniref:Uncharacterized protein n=1 Tax=uncultured Avibacterium sp. TaxID=1936169 RepID=A0A486XCM1_9PAST|nr:Uncharacterised protein [uncultured Avibacterium sp.]